MNESTTNSTVVSPIRNEVGVGLFVFEPNYLFFDNKLLIYGLRVNFVLVHIRRYFHTYFEQHRYCTNFRSSLLWRIASSMVSKLLNFSDACKTIELCVYCALTLSGIYVLISNLVHAVEHEIDRITTSSTDDNLFAD